MTAELCVQEFDGTLRTTLHPKMKPQTPQNYACIGSACITAELYHYRTTSRIVSEISADFCISRPKLTIRKSTLPDSEKVIKKRSLINEPNMDSSRLPEGLEFIQKHGVKRQRRTKSMPKSSQKDAKITEMTPKRRKWSKNGSQA